MSKLSRGTQNTNPLGTQSLVEANIVESRPINSVVNWALIVKKYWESIGVNLNQGVEEETNQAIGPEAKNIADDSGQSEKKTVEQAAS